MINFKFNERGTGKSTFLYNVAHEKASENKKVLFFVTNNMYSLRYITLRHTDTIINNNLEVLTYKVDSIISDLSKGDIYIFDEVLPSYEVIRFAKDNSKELYYRGEFKEIFEEIPDIKNELDMIFELINEFYPEHIL